MQANAIKTATKEQIQALERQRQFVYDNLEPSVVNEAAKAADIERTQQRLALQSQIDPSLLEARYASEKNLLDIAKQGATSQGDVLANQLFNEASQPDAKGQELKNKLMDAALEEINAGATLPPDVQAELIKAGLEQSGTIGTGTSQRSLAGQLSRRLIGNEALALKKARQDQSMKLGLASQELQNQRLGILSSVFPQLKNLQTQNAALQASVLNQSNAMVPEAGLGGSDIANIFLSRVGATNQITRDIASANAKQAIDVASAWSQALKSGGTVAGGIAKDAGLGSTGSLLRSVI